MSTLPQDAESSTPGPPAALRAVDDVLEGRSALEVLDAVSWDGPLLDPALLRADELLAYL